MSQLFASDEIQRELRQLLDRDFGFTETGGFLRKGRCPDCKKREVYARAERPFMLRCGRLDKCGWEDTVKDRYPEIFDDWSKRYVKSEKQPNAAADAYLKNARGFDIEPLKGAYSEEYFRDRDRQIGSATVRFPLPGGGHWERLIDQPGRFEKKANFAWGKSYSGHAWVPPGTSLEDLARADRIFLTEGIFDTLSFVQGPKEASVSLMTVYNWPEHFLSDLKKEIARLELKKSPKLIFAFDVGAAGVSKTRDFVKQAAEQGWTAGAAQVMPDGEGAKRDWNDLFLSGKLTAEALDEFIWNGEVTIAITAMRKAMLIWERKGWSSFAVNHGNKTYWANLNKTKMAKLMEDEESPLSENAAARQAMTVEEIANCKFRVLYRERDEATDETNYYLQVDFPDKTPTAKGRFSAASLTASAEFKKRLFAFSGIWTGAGTQLDRLMQQQTRGLKSVEPIDFTGYSREHGAYLLGTYAVRQGRIHQLNHEDYFDFGKLALKLRTSERILDIEWDADNLAFDWVEHVWTAYGAKGLIVTSFWIMSLFAEQIRQKQKSLPFLEVIGIPGTGKTTLIEFLWKLMGREGYEGFDPTKATNAAIARNLGKVANLPVVLIEGDRDKDAPHSRRFEWDELKTAYNGRAVRSRGVRNGGMETYDPPFRGAIVIAQNYAVEASPALLERIMQVSFDKSNWGAATKASAERIEQWPMEKLSGTILHILRHEERWLETYFARFSDHERALPIATGARNIRIVKNHAQLAAALDATRQLIPMREEWVEACGRLIDQMAEQRQNVTTADHPVVAAFWEKVDWLIANEPFDTDKPLNHHRKPDEYIAVSLNQFEEVCRHRGLNAPSTDELKKHLRTSKSRRYIDDKNVNSIKAGKTIHCWVFQQPAAQANRSYP